MKKFGFTLSEVLITLSIIGVIAAMTLPTLISNTTDAQIGPKLAKAVSAFEQANEALLSDNGVDALTDISNLKETGAAFSFNNYVDEISNYFKITKSDNNEHVVSLPNNTSISGNKFSSKDGFTYFVRGFNFQGTAEKPHKTNIGDVTIDINGPANPNAHGTDQFMFYWYNDGSLVPFGATGTSHTWTEYCPENDIPTDPMYCAGHIFENNLKVLYK